MEVRLGVISSGGADGGGAGEEGGHGLGTVRWWGWELMRQGLSVEAPGHG